MGEVLFVGLIASVVFFAGMAIGSTNASDSEPKSDSEIMQARNFVADYERRMEEVRPRIEECRKFNNLDFVHDCRKTVYDSVSFEYYDTDANLTSAHKSKYDSKKAIALYPLTSELK